MTTYVTRAEAIEREIIEPLRNMGQDPDHFDIDAIADLVLGDHSQGFACVVDPGVFGKSALDCAYEVVTYDSKEASTSSSDPRTVAYVKAVNLGAAETYLAQTGSRVEELPAKDGQRHERFIPSGNLIAAHGDVLEAERALARARAKRDKIVRDLHAQGVTMYSMGKDLREAFGDQGITPQAIGKIVKGR